MTLEQIFNQVNELFANETYIAEPNELYQPIEYTMHLGGKRLRPTMLIAANQMFGGDTKQVLHAAIAIETFHNFTLLHDDLMDKSPLRRGKPTVYRKWNENVAILSGDTMLAIAWKYILRQPHPHLDLILNCFNDTALGVFDGQQYDMNFETRDDVSIPEYMNMIRLKTAVLLAGALKIGALYANAPTTDIDKLYNFGIHLGLAFQLQDDLLDAFGDISVLGKQTGQDILDNKKTFLYLKALEMTSGQQQQQLFQLFCDEKFSTIPPQEKVARVLQIYRDIDIRTAVEQTIDEEFNKADSALQAILLPEDKKETLRQLSQTLLHRDK